MTINEAIRIMETGPPESASISDEDEEAAANLAIEAMKVYAQARRLGMPLLCDRLPGETPEETEAGHET